MSNYYSTFNTLIQSSLRATVSIGITTLFGCSLQSTGPSSELGQLNNSQSQVSNLPGQKDSSPFTAQGITSQDVITQSWETYRQRFIQTDGRVIDREDKDRSTSEGQAYAMLRAVLIDDPETFSQTLQWAEENLRRHTAEGVLQDHLWSWRWGQHDDGTWGTIDKNFASDADIDAITALILAGRRWNRLDYLELAQLKLADLWEYSTLMTTAVDDQSGSMRYLLPGPVDAFKPQPNQVYLNPSYMAPYAFRLFAQVDPRRDWMSLVESSYGVLEASSELAASQLPGDWVLLNMQSGQFELSDADTLPSVYSFDAYRVWWRVRLDALWFDEPRANAYLQSHLTFLIGLWQSQRFIPARITTSGKATVSYESTAQYAMLYFGLQGIEDSIAQQILEEKLEPSYQNGFWDNNTAYYVQNLGWFAFYPFESLDKRWLTQENNFSQAPASQQITSDSL